MTCIIITIQLQGDLGLAIMIYLLVRIITETYNYKKYKNSILKIRKIIIKKKKQHNI